MSVFKSGSIRGIYGKDWNRETVYRIGYYLVSLLDAKTAVIGRDGRLSSSEIFEALTEGLLRAGCSVTDIGMIDSPGVPFANIIHGFDCGIMITASHNPPEYNGLKISGKKALVISQHNGLLDLEDYIQKEPGPFVPGGSLNVLNIIPDYLEKLGPYKESVGNLKCIVDCSNGMGSVLVHKVIKDLPGEYAIINDNIDGNFPAHGPNPTIESSLSDIKKQVLDNNANLGVCFDGDGDRTIFIDEKGNWVSPDLIIAMLGLYYFKHFPERRGDKDGVLYDARSTNSISDFISSIGGKSYICSTGHTAMQEGLPALNGIYGGELPGHYYYSDFYNLDNGWIPFLQIQAILSLEKKSFSEIIHEINNYSFSGEINFKISNGESLIEKIKEKYSYGKQTFLDGVRVDFADWWFLVRMANTEPILRLVVEGKNDIILEQKAEELRSFIYQAGGLDHFS
jgi:phosphomannomutase